MLTASRSPCLNSTTSPQPKFFQENGTDTLHFHQPKFYCHEHIFFPLDLLRKGITLHMARLFLTICKSGEQLLSHFSFMSRPTGAGPPGNRPQLLSSLRSRKCWRSLQNTIQCSIRKVFQVLLFRNTKWKRQILTSELNQPVFLYSTICWSWWLEVSSNPARVHLELSTHNVSTKPIQMPLKGCQNILHNPQNTPPKMHPRKVSDWPVFHKDQVSSD